MANLAIRGHATRGKEVIEILEMLGGKNKYLCCGVFANRMYLISDSGNIEDIHSTYEQFSDYQIYTLEQFLEKYPYKIGDKVYNIVHNENQIITNLVWQEDEVIYLTNTNEYVYVNYLQPYKEETMEELIRTEDITLEKSVMCTFLEMVEGEQRLRIAMNEGFELKEENGKFFVYKKNIKYPKTYKECCHMLNIPFNGDIVYAGNWVYGGEYLDKHLDKLRNFQKLFICRNAYWKIAGEQMGLGKPWEPDWTKDTEKYVIYPYQYLYSIDVENYRNTLLAFPSEEMRDAFYENFKELIELVKELL